MPMVRESYTASELADLLSLTRQGIEYRASREGWQSRKRDGRGGGKDWLVSSMDKETRAQIFAALERQALIEQSEQAGSAQTCAPIGSNSSASIGSKSKKALDRDRAIVTARLAFCHELDRIVPLVGKTDAINYLVTGSQQGTLAPVLMSQLEVVFARRRNGHLTTRTLYRWYADYLAGGEDALLPKRTPSKEPDWAAEFLTQYQKPQHPTVALAHANLCHAMQQRGETPPSIHACRRLLAKMSVPEREEGRATGNAMLKLRPYQRRSTDELWPTDCYTADGTTFDAEVLHPDHGQPWKPEITAVLDVATRRCVGVSIGLAESALTVLDALRMACCFGGIPALWYTDNGAGYVNKLMLDDRTGMLIRLGITPTNSIPKRPQGKGLMERAVKTLWVRAAQGLESYTGALMDPDAAHENFKKSRAALKKGKRAVLPTWEEFKKHILARVEEYNNTPQRDLPSYRDAQGRNMHYSPNQYWQTFVDRGFEPVRVPEGTEAELFMPGETRITRNGWLQFYNGRYYSSELAEFHSKAIEVRYDIWDTSKVWCWTPDGAFICVAVLEGNTRPYFDKDFVTAARRTRAKEQVGRINARLQRVAPGATITMPEEPHAVPVMADSIQRPALEASASTESATITLPEKEVVEAKPVRPIFTSTHDRYRWVMKHPDDRTDADDAWLKQYRQSEEYADLQELYAAEGIA